MFFSYLFPFGNDFLFLTIGSLSAHFPTADCFVIGLSFYCRTILLGNPKRMVWQWSDEKTARKLLPMSLLSDGLNDGSRSWG